MRELVRAQTAEAADFRIDIGVAGSYGRMPAQASRAVRGYYEVRVAASRRIGFIR